MPPCGFSENLSSHLSTARGLPLSHVPLAFNLCTPKPRGAAGAPPGRQNFTFRKTEALRREGLALNQGRRWAPGLWTPVPGSSFLEVAGVQTRPPEFKRSLEQNRIQASALHPDATAKSQAGDLHEAATNKGYAGNATPLLCTRARADPASSEKPNSNCLCVFLSSI